MIAVAKTKISLVRNTARRLNAYQPTKWDEEERGPLTVENMKRIYEPEGFLVGCVILKPGTKFERHKHDKEFLVFNMGGEYRLDFDDQTVELAPGEYFDIPLGVPHTETVGNEEAMKFGVATKDWGLALIFGIALAFEKVASRFTKIFQK